MNRSDEARPKWPVRVGLAITAALYLVYSSFGIAAPFWWGHHGYHGATYMLRARMSLRFHMLAPATYTGYEFPPLNALYFHHPIGYHHLLTVLVPIFGEHEWLARGVAALGGLAALWALYALVKRGWSREVGLAAVIVYVCLPMITSFSVLSDPMLLTLACVAWSLWAYLELLEKPSRRALCHAAAAYAIGGLLMWEAYFIGPFIFIHGLLYARTRRGKTLRLGNWNAAILHGFVIGAAATASMLFHIWYTWHANAWGEFLESYRIRHSPPSGPYVIDRHTQWMTLLYGKWPIVFGAIWFALWLMRLAAGRARRRDLATLTFLYVNTLYIYMFAEGSSVHLYRVFFYSGFFALAVADLVDEAHRAARALTRRALVPAAAAVAVLALYLGLELPQTYNNWIESRALGGTHGQAGYNPEAEKMLVARELTRMTTPDQRVIVHYGQLGARKEMWFYLDRNFDNISTLAELDRRRKDFAKSVLFVDERALGSHERKIFHELIAVHPVTFYDHFAVVDLRKKEPLARSFAFAPQPMTRAYRWFVSHKYPPLALKRAGYLPGICQAVAVGAGVAADEALAPWPRDASLLPCYRDYLAARGDLAAVKEIDEVLRRGLRPVDAPLGSARVLAAGLANGRLKVLFTAGGPLDAELRYLIKGASAAQTRSRATAPLPSTWRAGRLYIDEVPLGGGPVELSVELVRVPPPPVPPGRWKVPGVAPVAPPIVVEHVDLGTIP